MGRVEAKEVIVDDVYKSTRESAESAEKAVKTLSDELQRQLDLQVQLAKNVKKGAKGLQEMNKLEGKSKKILSEKEKLDKKILKQRQLLTKVDKQSIAASKSLSVEQQRRNKLATQTAKLQNKNIGAFERLNIKIKQQSDRYRDLLVQEGKETKETKKLQKNILKLNAARDKANQSIGIHSAKVGKYENALKGATGALAKLGLGFGVFQLLKGTLKIVSGFDTAMASLSAITGATGDDLENFKGKVLDVASNTKKSASEVAKAFELIGSAKPALLGDADALAQVTEQAIILSQATGLDLDVSATALTNTLNQFSLGAEEAARVINVLAAGSQAGAAPVDQINEAMGKFGTVADAVGVSVEESVGAIEVLAEKSIVGAEAGTKFRNILTTLSVVDALPDKAQQAMAKYGVNTDIVSDSTLDLSTRLAELGKISEDQTALFQVFGKENLVAGQVLLQNTGALDNYTDAVTGTNTAVDQAATNQNTFAAIIEQLKAAWEALVLKWSEGTGVLDILKSVLKFVADNLELIVKVVARAAAIFGTYKLALKAANAAQKAFGGNLAKMKKSFGAVGIAIAAVLLIVQNLVDAYGNAFTAASQFEKAQEEVNAQVVDAKAKLQIYGKQLLATNTGSRERLKLINQINAEHGTTLENLEDEAAFVQQVAEAYKNLVQQLTNKIEAQVFEEKLLEATRKLIDVQEQIKEAGGRDAIGGFGDAVGEALLGTEEELQKLVDKYGAKIIQIQQTAKDVGNVTSDTMRGAAEDLNAVEEAADDVAESIGGIGDAVEKVFTPMTDEEINNFVQDFTGDLEEGLDDIDYSVKKEIGVEIESGDEAFEASKRAIEQLDFLEKKRQQQIAETWKLIRDNVSETLQFIEQFYARNIELIEKQQEAQQGVFDDSKEREQELKDIAKERGLNADESINAEREKQKAALQEQQDLERKKQRVAALIAALQLLSAKVEAGEGNPVQNIKSQISNLKGFIDGEFYEGTEYTVADALGATGTRDGHVVRIDDNESVLTGDQTRAMNIGKGGNSTNDIVDIYKQSLQRKMNPRDLITQPNQMADSIIASKLDEVIATNKSSKDVGKMAFDGVVGALTYKKKGTKYVYPVRKR